MLHCRDVSAASELLLELWDVGGSRNTKHLENLAHDPTKVIGNSRFMGRVEVPLSETLSLRRGAFCFPSSSVHLRDSDCRAAMNIKV